MNTFGGFYEASQQEQVTIIRHRHAGKAFARREWNDLAFILTRGGFVMLEDSL